MGEARLLVGGMLARADLPDSARAVMAGARLDRSMDSELDLVFIEAYMRVLVGDQDEAIDLLKRWLVAHPEVDHGLEDGMNWWWRPLQSHPRFAELLRGGSLATNETGHLPSVEQTTLPHMSTPARLGGESSLCKTE